MSSKKEAQIWFKQAKYDLETAKELLVNKRFIWTIYTAGQAVEKLLKGVFVKNNRTPPRTHDLELLIREINKFRKLKIKKTGFLELKSLYKRIRYPLLTDEQAPFEKIYQKDAVKCLKQAQNIFYKTKR